MNGNKGNALLVLGAGTDQLFMIRTAHEMPLKTTTVDGNPYAPDLKEATYSEPIDFSRIDEVIGYVDRLMSPGRYFSFSPTLPHISPATAWMLTAAFTWVEDDYA